MAQVNYSQRFSPCSLDSFNDNVNSRMSYISFPSPVSGRSPTLPRVRVPKYGYYNLERESITPTSSSFEFFHSGPVDVRKNSVLRALIQSINYFVGIGVLALPYALRTTGWFGLILLVIFGIMMTYTAWLFGRSRRKLSLENFSDHVEFAFTVKGRVIISLVFYASMLINAALFTKLLSETIASLTGLSVALSLIITAAGFMVITNLCTTAASPLTRIMSILGTASIVVLLLALVTAEASALLRFEIPLRGVESEYVSVSAVTVGVWSYTYAERVYITDLVACLKTLGIFGYCYMGHEVFPAIFHNMRHPKCFTFVVSIAFACMVLCYATIAALGYLAYGSHSAGNIINNLPTDDAITLCAKACLIVTVLAKLTQCAAPLSEGLLEWTRLLVYMVSHTKYLAGLVQQPARPMPRLRLDSSSLSVVPSQSTYGTYRSQQDTRPLHAPPVHTSQETRGEALHCENNYSPFSSSAPPPGFDLNAQRDRRKYFDTSYFHVAEEMKAHEMNENSRLLSTSKTLDVKIPSTPPRHPLDRSALHHSDSRDAPRLIRSTSSQRAEGSVTPRRGLTWSDTLPIPPIRSPSCATLLASSAESSTIHSLPQSNLLSALPTLLRDTSKEEEFRAEEVEEGAESSSESSSTDTYDLFLDDADMPPPHSRLYSDFQDMLGTSQLTAHSAADTHLSTAPGSECDQEQMTCAACGEYFLAHILPVVIRCALPLVAVLISVAFDRFVGMVIFTGGVCGGLVSIVIPAWAYYNIHQLELSTVEASILCAIIFTGAAIAVCTTIVCVVN